MIKIFLNLHKKPFKEIISLKEEESHTSSDSIKPTNQKEIEGVFYYDGNFSNFTFSNTLMSFIPVLDKSNFFNS